MTADTKPHSRCVDCGEEFETRDAARKHGEDTMQPESPERQAQGYIARGHATMTLNPTDEELLDRRIRSAIEDALDDACMSLERDIDRGYFTEEQLQQEIAFHPDLDGAWQGRSR